MAVDTMRAFPLPPPSLPPPILLLLLLFLTIATCSHSLYWRADWLVSTQMGLIWILTRSSGWSSTCGCASALHPRRIRVASVRWDQGDGARPSCVFRSRPLIWPVDISSARAEDFPDAIHLPQFASRNRYQHSRLSLGRLSGVQRRSQSAKRARRSHQNCAGNSARVWIFEYLKSDDGDC